MNPLDGREPVRLTLTPLANPSGPPSLVGLRRFLKAVLRSYGWRCVRIEVGDRDVGPDPDDDKPANGG